MDNKKKIIIADDELHIRLLVKRILGTDYVVLEANNGKEAIDITRTENPDLILMDFMMPIMDGRTACRAIKSDAATRTIPVVMITGAGHELNKKLGQAIGADGYVTKPFSPQGLLETIKQLEATSCPVSAQLNAEGAV